METTNPFVFCDKFSSKDGGDTFYLSSRPDYLQDDSCRCWQTKKVAGQI